MLRDLELFLTVALRTGADGWAVRRAANRMSVYCPSSAAEVRPC
jgi:hypothetical protein